MNRKAPAENAVSGFQTPRDQALAHAGKQEASPLMGSACTLRGIAAYPPILLCDSNHPLQICPFRPQRARPAMPPTRVSYPPSIANVQLVFSLNSAYNERQQKMLYVNDFCTTTKAAGEGCTHMKIIDQITTTVRDDITQTIHRVRRGHRPHDARA